MILQRSYLSTCWARCSSRSPVLLLILHTLLGVTGCGKEETRPPARPVEVSVVKIEPRDTPITFEYVAQTQSSHQVEIRARVNGFLEKRLYKEGAIVKAGQTLFVLDKKPFQAQVDAAALSKQKAALETARRNLERVKPLAERNALSKKDLDDAVGSHESLAAAVEQAEAELQTAQLNLSYCTITSPVTGITGAALQQDGAYVSAQNSHLTTVAVLSPIWVNHSVSENEMQNYRDQVAKKLIIPPARKQSLTTTGIAKFFEDITPSSFPLALDEGWQRYGFGDYR